jgi:hypothetical protein
MAETTVGEFTRRAIEAHVARPLVAILGANLRLSEQWVGSGTLFRIGRHVVILTAAHVASEAQNHDLQFAWPGAPGPVERFVAEVRVHPREDLDVGALLVKAENVGLVAPRALSLDAIDGAALVAGPDDAIGVAGWPAALCQVDTARRHLHLTPFLYETDVEQISDGTDGHKPGLHLHWGDIGGEPDRAPHPKGISGGPVWWFRRHPRDELWSPDTGRIVGIAVGYHAGKKWQRAAAARDWSAWFTATCAEFERT